MHNMEDGVGSGDGSSDVIKKKSSSGCLIIKKKGNGVLGFGGSGSKQVFESRNDKKRSRLVDADSGSSDELVEPVRRKVREDIIYERRKSGIELEDARMAGFGGERKRSGLDVFEFDEYDGFDGKKMRMDYWNDRLKGAGRSGNYRDYGAGASKNVVYRSEDNERKGSMSGVKSKKMHNSGKGRYEAEEEEDDDDDESHLPISFLKEKYREAPSDRIRLQGKNGVLKVMVKKKKQGFPDKGSDYQRADEGMGSRSEAAVKKNEVIRPAFYSDSKRPGKPVSLKTEKSHKKSGKTLPILSSKAEDSETDDSEKSLEQESMSKQTQRSKKAIKNEHKKATNEQKKITPAEISTPPGGGKESKVTRGNGTEKQLLREKIRSMLLERGWRIDYRPRRNRDYLDAVYINPAGTAYWSIIKAYDALQKQLEEEEDKIKPCGESTSSTALPEEIISKLTRQTRKKIERDLKKKKRDASCNRSAKEATMRESANGTDSDQQEEKLSSYMKQSNKSLKGKLHDDEADHVDENDSSDGLYKRKGKQDLAEKQSPLNSHMIQGRKSKKIGRCTLLARSSDNGLNSGPDGYVPCTGKRTLLSWLIDSGIVHMSEKVQYMNRRKTKVMLEGWITKDGIHCGCCSKILTVSKFEIHAGSKHRQPFPNMYLESGLSLMQCQIDAWNKQEESEREGFHNVDVDGDDPNDDTCGLCGDGGDLICCDGCPSTFHQSCLDIKILPAGDWHCPNCTCKFCGFAGCSNDKTNDKTGNPLLLCSLCEKKYHQSCSQDEVDLSVDSGGTANSFCGKNCQEIFSHLQKLLGVKQELESGFSWSVVHRMDPASETLHFGFPQRIECNSKLAVALSVMDECFLPIVDRRSGINLIHKVLYNCGSNFSRLNYSGFYTAILERGDEIMSVASIRIHGNQLAEMPFIGTRHIYRRQGMCRRLLSAIKSALRTLKVEKLIIPAIAEHMQTWTKIFKFSPLKESHKREMRSMNMLVFPRTDMLQKLLVKREIMEESTSNNSGSQSTELKENCLLLPVLGEKSELDSSPEHDTHMSDHTELQPLTESSNKVPALISASETPTLVTNDISAVCGSLASSCEPKDEKSVLDLSPEHDAHMSDNTELLPLTESSDKATALISASETPNLASNEIPVLSTSLASSCEPKNEPAMAETPPINPLSDNNLAELQPLTESSDKATMLISASEAPTPASNDIPAISSSLVSYCEPKHEPALGETPAINPSSDNNLAESIVNSKSTSPCNENPSTIAADNAVLGSYLKDHTQSFANDDVTDVLDMNAKAADDSLQETSAANIEEDATAIQNSLFVHNSVSCDRSESTHVDSDMNNDTAVDLGNTCEVNVDGTLSNPPKKAVEKISAVDTVDVDSARETSVGSEEDAVAIRDPVHVLDSVSRGTCENIHNGSGMGKDTAVDLDHTCEVKVNDTFVISSKDSVELLSTINTVEEDLAANGTITLCKGGNVVNSTHAVHEKVACVKSVTDSFDKAVAQNNTAEAIGEGPTESSSATVVVGDERNGDLINTEKGDERGDAQQVNVEVAFVEPIVDSVCDTSTENNTCQALDESSKDVKSDSVDRSLVEIVETESDLHVTTEVVGDERNGDLINTEKGDEGGDAQQVNVEVASVEPIVDSVCDTSTENNTCQALDESSKDVKSDSIDRSLVETESDLHVTTEVVGDERNGDLINTEKGDEHGDAQQVNVEVASVEPIGDSVCDTSTENNTCQALDESSKDVKSDSIDRSLVETESDLHVTTEVASNTNH